MKIDPSDTVRLRAAIYEEYDMEISSDINRGKKLDRGHKFHLFCLNLHIFAQVNGYAMLKLINTFLIIV